MPKRKEESVFKVSKVRVGPDFQADIPELLVLPARPTFDPRDIKARVWAPTERVSDVKLNEYLLLAEEKYGYEKEQAMGMLYRHHYDMEEAISDLPNFAPIPDVWTREDEVNFESAFKRHGKDFVRIKRMMPHKPTASLVKHYYMWKRKKQMKEKVIDKKIKQKNIGSGSAVNQHHDEV